MPLRVVYANFSETYALKFSLLNWKSKRPSLNSREHVPVWPLVNQHNLFLYSPEASVFVKLESSGHCFEEINNKKEKLSEQQVPAPSLNRNSFKA